MLAVDSGIFLEISSAASDALLQYRVSRQASPIPDDLTDEIEILDRYGVFDHAPRDTYDPAVITCLNLNVCHNCNISCSYCFAGDGLYGDKVAVMERETARRAIDLLLDQLPPDQSGNIVFFGGEPLLHKEMMLETIAYGRGKRSGDRKDIVFDIFTNGTVLDEEIGTLLNKDANVRMLISLDGPPGINDHFRHGCGRTGVSKTVRENFRYLDQVPRERIVIRCTIADTEPRIVERAGYFLDCGMTNLVFDPAFCPDIERIPFAADIYDAMRDELPDVSLFLIDRIKGKQKVNINILSEMIFLVLRNNPAAVTTYTPPCPAGGKYLSIDAHGNVYPCHYFVGNRDFVLGRLGRDGLTQRDMVRENGVEDLSRGNSTECRECYLRNLCEGPCPYKRIVLYGGDLRVQHAYCRYMKARLKTGLGVLGSFYESGTYPYRKQWNTLFDGKTLKS